MYFRAADARRPSWRRPTALLVPGLLHPMCAGRYPYGRYRVEDANERFRFAVWFDDA